jgi:hypothetical protein
MRLQSILTLYATCNNDMFVPPSVHGSKGRM